ncbi:MAG: tetratricopeptide repeat protein [Planctomycetes bacterium]|nr:tetratricopeptide repeat protein [Planctomycetota bacterium]
MKRDAVVLLALLALAACAAAPARPADATDPAIYRRVDPAIAAEWERAQAAFAIDDVDTAWPLLSVIVQKSPDLVRAHLMYQDAAIEIGGEAEAEMRRYYHFLIPERETPVVPYVRARLSDTSYAKGQALQAILRQDPTFGWAHLSLGRVRRGQGQLLAAVDSFQAALRFDDSLHEAQLERAQALADLGRLPEAAANYEDYLEQEPGDLAAVREYAAMLIYRLVRIDRALELLGRLDQAFPEDVDLRMHRAAALWRAFRPREALSNYLAVLERDPRASRAALNIGLIYYDAMPQNDTAEERRQWWPRARAAFRYFLAIGDPADGHEAFERALAVPYRLEEIERLLGPAAAGEVSLDALRLPPG